LIKVVPRLASALNLGCMRPLSSLPGPPQSGKTGFVTPHKAKMEQ
jgi:hypothetical protein